MPSSATNSVNPNSDAFPSTSMSAPQSPDKSGTSPFHAYIHGNVKHRKRTNPHQLEVLERVYSVTTKKPQAKQRMQLATELDMTPRGVQVWFQNRRAKDKNEAAKATRTSDINQHQPPSPTSDSLPSPTESFTTKSLHESEESLSSQGTPAPTLHQELPVMHEHQSNIPVHANPASISAPQLPIAPPSSFHLADAQIAEMRRSSLPTHLLPTHPHIPSHIHSHSHAGNTPPPPTPAQLASRRSSTDNRAARLMSHPYARLALQRNNCFAGRAYASTPTPGSGLVSLGVPSIARSRPNLGHRASLPCIPAPDTGMGVGMNGVDAYRRVTGPPPPSFMHPQSLAPIPGPVAVPVSAMPPPAVHAHVYQQTYGVLPSAPAVPAPNMAMHAPAITARRTYAVPRPSQMPIPGPLPSPGFSFGQPGVPALPSSTNTSPDDFDAVPLPPHDYPPVPTLPTSAYGPRRSVDWGSSLSLGAGAGLMVSRGDEDDANTTGSWETGAFTRFGSLTSVTSSRTSGSAGGFEEDRADGEWDCVRRDSLASFSGGFDELNLGYPSESYEYADNTAQQLNDVEISAYSSPASTISPESGSSAHDASPAPTPEMAYVGHQEQHQAYAPHDGYYVDQQLSTSPIATTSPDASQAHEQPARYYGYEAQVPAAVPLSTSSSSSSLDNAFGADAHARYTAYIHSQQSQTPESMCNPDAEHHHHHQQQQGGAYRPFGLYESAIATAPGVEYGHPAGEYEYTGMVQTAYV